MATSRESEDAPRSNEDFLTAEYAQKDPAYYEECRPEMLPYIPASSKRVLEVGCGSGGFGALIRETLASEVWGIEPFESAALMASRRLNRVLTSTFSRNDDLPAGFFDCIVFNDVLEHLTAPEAALLYSHELLVPGGSVVASIPNIAHFPTIWRLVVHGEWLYRDCGTLDRTHLRFFTRSSVLQLFQSAGFATRTIAGIHPYRGIPNVTRRLWRAYRLANLLALGRFEDMRYERFAVVARKDGSARPLTFQ